MLFKKYKRFEHSDYFIDYIPINWNIEEKKILL